MTVLPPPPPGLPGADERPRRGIWRRYLLGAALIVIATAASTATAALHEIAQIGSALKLSPRLKLGSALTPSEAGSPQTLLVIGSDKRAQGAGIDAASPPHSDTLMLVRLNPDARATTMLSIPRDLKVTIDPPNGQPTTQKINAAYAIGGPKLTVDTVRRVIGVKINHVIDVNFRGFKDAVDALGCVYADVDRRYFNDNAGLGPGQGYATIDIQPGYQRLCGQNALDYVRYRHTDSDILRAARQQDFLRQAKQQVGASDLLSRRGDLEKIFGRYAQTDIRGTHQTLDLLALFAYSVGHPVERVPFPAHAGPSFVYASPDAIGRAVAEFLHPSGAAGPSPGTPAPGASGHGRGRRRSSRSQPAAGLIPATADDLAQAQSAAATAGLPVWMDRQQAQLAPMPDSVRDYALRGTDGRVYRAYRIVVAAGLVGEYYGIEGTTWLNPPLLDAPNTKKKAGGRTFMLFYDGQRLRFVAWRAGRDLYWVSNTLTDQLTNSQMLSIATHTRPIG